MRTFLHGLRLRQVKQLRVESKFSELLLHFSLVARVGLRQIGVLLPKLEKVVYVALIYFLLFREAVILRPLRSQFCHCIFQLLAQLLYLDRLLFVSAHDFLEAGQRNNVFEVLELRFHLHRLFYSELELFVHFFVLHLGLLHLLFQVAVLLDLCAHGLVVLRDDLFKSVVCEV